MDDENKEVIQWVGQFGTLGRMVYITGWGHAHKVSDNTTDVEWVSEWRKQKKVEGG